MKTTILAVLCAAILGGCGGGGSSWFSNNCDDKMDDLKKARGNPEEINRYDSGDYHSVKWWYWTKGFERTFTWSNDISCQTSDYTFTAIK
jgi:hypothetical protein